VDHARELISARGEYLAQQRGHNVAACPETLLD
jgi:hypothetical protein